MTIDEKLQNYFSTLQAAGVLSTPPGKKRVLDIANFSDNTYFGAYITTNDGKVFGRIHHQHGIQIDQEQAIRSVQQHITERYRGMHPIFSETSSSPKGIRFKARLHLPE